MHFPFHFLIIIPIFMFYMNKVIAGKFFNYKYTITLLLGLLHARMMIMAKFVVDRSWSCDLSHDALTHTNGNSAGLFPVSKEFSALSTTSVRRTWVTIDL